MMNETFFYIGILYIPYVISKIISGIQQYSNNHLQKKINDLHLNEMSYESVGKLQEDISKVKQDISKRANKEFSIFQDVLNVSFTLWMIVAYKFTGSHLFLVLLIVSVISFLQYFIFAPLIIFDKSSDDKKINYGRMISITSILFNVLKTILTFIILFNHFFTNSI